MTVRMVLTVLGILSILYFWEYFIFVGFNNSFLLFWLVFGIFCLVWGYLHEVIRKKGMASLIFAENLFSGGFVVFLLAVCVTLVMIIKAGAEQPEKGADYLIILGAHVYGERMSSNLRYRVEIGKKYLEENPETKVILSGGKGRGEDISEAEAMRRYLVEKGISEDRMLLEDQSVNTDENIRNSRALMKEQDAFVVIATNRFHLLRAEGIARKQGIRKVQGIGQYVRVDTIPNCYLREVIAVWKYKICGQI